DAQQVPPATQLRYEDPDAMQMKQEIMSRMMGRPGCEVKTAAATAAAAVDHAAVAVSGGGGGRTLRRR
ncbi:hypothetical protein E4U41_006558, partial [Claviceps citrina]